MIFFALCTFLILSSRVAFGLYASCASARLPIINAIRIIPQDVICAVVGLEDISLDRERIEFNLDNVNVSAFNYVDFTTDTYDKRFTTFPAEIFEIFPNIMGIVVKSNLEKFTPNDWRNVINLESIFADSNKITELGTFNGLKNLQQLSLRSNKLNIIQEGTFVGTDRLRLIDLKFNQIHTIEDGAFDTPSLEALDLNRNKLTKLSDLVFSKIPKLMGISISNNKLMHIGRSLFSLPNIVNINLNRNRIEDIDLTAFSKLRRLKGLRLNGSGFSFDLSKEMRIVQNTSDENTSLEDLDIRNNNLRNAYDLYELRIFKGLKNLWLSGNAYIDFELSAEEIKYSLPNLKMLNLDGQKLWCEDLSLLQQQLQQLNIELYSSQSCCACIN